MHEPVPSFTVHYAEHSAVADFALLHFTHQLLAAWG